MTTATAIEAGIVRLVYTDANQSYESIVWEGRTEEFLKVDQATKHEMEQNPTCFKTPAGLGEDDLLLVKFKPDTADTIDLSECFIRIPIERKNITTKKAWEDLLTQASFTAVSGQADIGTGVFTEVGRYAIPAQQRVRIGHIISDARVDSKLQLVMMDKAVA